MLEVEQKPAQNRSKKDWEELIIEQASSGKSTAEFCLEYGLKPSTFSTNKYRLKKAGFQKKAKLQSEAKKFMPVQLIGEEQPKEEVALQGKELRIIFRNGHQVMLEGLTSEKVISVLEKVANLAC